MKYLMLTFMLMAFTACGPAAVLNSGCGGEMRPLCDAAFGPHDKEKEKEDSNELESLKQELMSLINSLESKILTLNKEVEKYVQEIYKKITEISSKSAVLESIDPCGDGSGVDQLLFKLSPVTLVTYNPNSNNASLFLLTVGTHKTKDAQKCSFTVDSSGNVTW